MLRPRYRFVTASRDRMGSSESKALITLGGDDGTRTHDPLLANLTVLNVGEQHGAHGLISGAPGAASTHAHRSGCSQNVPIVEFVPQPGPAVTHLLAARRLRPLSLTKGQKGKSVFFGEPARNAHWACEAQLFAGGHSGVEHPKVARDASDQAEKCETCHDRGDGASLADLDTFGHDADRAV